ncbi:bifunctional 3-(3-hydroxy-phenyl)propionate/3-hydroxycinnamic acid hydroxylase [Streptomyces sp. P38-E01]|uniref:Bifunctional 3-(3-hydroxy-phenyl)propionate/3-hydroxycinnamic acid hydroxylase n=1 Tax=Streptomyces tardus TaxID=2780544 RepID=A0A949JHM9_9ACTN|nr:bifunctional 3-(3-hydroxy-phenyl)propionate/3-hydroxycinnamic acid hydroxylase [Streptomyces tardus]MBU7598800.1 bifunctional 3-(3-hydroxy-phenyl)propionate/3-hydroxycinnamic acid hydroxylase [Streptomyces tardus]
MNGPSEPTARDDGDTDADVLVIGYGPVGQALSVLLAQHGWRVTVLERQPRPYPLPRAVAFDGQASRLLAAAGVADRIRPITEPSPDYVVANAAGGELLRFELRPEGYHGWPDSTSVHQPSLEAALAERAGELPGLRVEWGRRAVLATDLGETVEVVTEDVHSGERSASRARWVVGSDGANSFLRDRLGVGCEDFGFSLDWMACDVVPRRAEDFPPLNLQIADPARPRVAVSAGPGHRRWEFMRLPDEDPAEFATEENAWRLLAQFGATPANAALDRHTVYTFAGRNAERWRIGRMLLAGDAAHQMPPFAGQGMCSGFRDAANLAWKLDLVLRGTAAERLLDTYEEERRAQVRYSIGLSVQLGRIICEIEPARAEERDRAMLRPPTGDAGTAGASGAASTEGAAGTAGVAGVAGTPGTPGTAGEASRSGGPGETGAARPPAHGARPPGETLGRGFFFRGGGAPAGLLAGQARLAGPGGAGTAAPADEVLGEGFVLLCAPELVHGVEPELLEELRLIGGRAVTVRPADGRADGGAVPRESDSLLDIDGFYLPWLASLGARAVLVRPDHYVYGAASDAEGVAALLRDLTARLTASEDVDGGDRGGGDRGGGDSSDDSGDEVPEPPARG